MKKNKLFILLSIITLILIFGLAATCNLCGNPITVGEEETTQESKEPTEETTRQTQQSQQTTQQTQGEASAPTIELIISEGPLYSEADDVCYWRVEATVTGNPAPSITWSKDDSGGTLGVNIAQVNLTRDNPEYTLVGIAKNSIDTATDEITVRWECDGEVVAEGNNDNSNGAGNQEVEFILPIIQNEYGVLYDANLPVSGIEPKAGDVWAEDQSTMGFISFDTSTLTGIVINEAILEMDGDISGDPSFFNKFWITSIYWGTMSIEDANLEILSGEGNIIESYPSDGSCDITCSVPKLKEEIQKAINESRPRFQIRIHFSGPYTDEDGHNDEWFYLFDDIKLKLKYIP